MSAGKNAKGRAAKRSTSRKGDPQSGSVEANVPPTRQTGMETATGQAIREAAGEEEVPQGKDRGSPVEIIDGPEGNGEDPQKPKGLQAKRAIFTSNGQVPHDMVASPTGLVPVSVVATSPEHAQELMQKREEEHQRYVERTVNKRDALDEATVGRLGRAELRAIGLQRGYEMPEAGTRATRAAFLAGQEKDTLVAKNGNGSKGSAKNGAKTASNRQMEGATRAAAPKGEGRTAKKTATGKKGKRS